MRRLLKNYFGFDDFRPLQEEIIKHVLEKNDALILMPTGGGKSLCYQLPALKFDGLTLVISPLISLMKDQVDSLKANGVAAEFINSSLTPDQLDRVERLAQSGQLKILYLAPERLALFNFQNFLRKLRLSLIAVDEAHCISEWGHDFRPDYRNLIRLRENFPLVPVAALTATATEKVRLDIMAQLNLKAAKVFISSFNRPNLTYIVRPKKNVFNNLAALLEKYKDRSAIIYCFSRKETEELSADLRGEGHKALPYHAGLDNNLRRQTQDKFVHDEIQIIVATIAFGMGIDKPDVRLIVHYSLPKSIEGYYQETGRAGRDGLSSECVFFYSYGDTIKHEYFFRDIADPAERANAKKKLSQVIEYAELKTCRRRYLLEYFGEKIDEFAGGRRGSLTGDYGATRNHNEGAACGGCDICLSPKEEFDGTVVAQKILSAVVRTGERFGANHIVKVLRGSSGRRVLELNHDKLSVFGIMRDYEEGEIKYYIGLLAAKGLLVKQDGEYPTIGLSAPGRKFLSEQQRITLVKPQTAGTELTEAGAKAGKLEYEAELFTHLRFLRKQLADRAGVPPFVIFSDVSLEEMAYYLPQSQASLLSINGVGALKLERYGQAFLKTITDYTQKNKLSERPNLSRARRSAPTRTVLREGSTYDLTLKMLTAGLALEKIAEARSLSLGTVVAHLEKLKQSGRELRLDHIKPPDDRFLKIKAAFTQSGGLMLAPVREILGEEYGYDELRLARLFLNQ